MFGNRSTDALNGLVRHRKPTEDVGTAPISEVSDQCFTVRLMLFSEEFSQGLALCAANFYCDEIALERMIFFSASLMAAEGKPCTHVGEVKK